MTSPVRPYRSRLLLPETLPFSDPRERRWFYNYRGAGVRTLFYDEFNRTDSTTTLGDPWVAVTRTWGVTGGAAYVVGGGSPARAVVDIGVADCAVQVRIAAFGPDSPGLCFRLVDASNYWRLVRSSGVVLTLQKRIAGSLSTVGDNFAYTGNDGDVLGVVLRGSSITCFLNGAPIISATDSAMSTATKHGLYSATATEAGRWDNFRVTA